MSDNVSILPAETDEIRNIYDKYSSTGRSEFEITRAYQERLVVEAGATTFTFIVSPLLQRYDADAQRVVLRLDLNAAWTDIYESSLLVPLDDHTQTTTEKASNALGVTIQYEKKFERPTD